MEHQDSSGCRECSNGNNFLLVTRRSTRCSSGPATAAGAGSAAGRSSAADGPGLRRRPNPAVGAGDEHDSGGSTQIESARTLGLRWRTLQETQPGGAPVSTTERLPPRSLLLALTLCQIASGQAASPASHAEFTRRLVAAAIERTNHRVRYISEYLRIPYPGGDVPS